MSDTYPLARDGVFVTVQGEGALLGLPMCFIRLAGCSVGCPNCDTDYRVSRRLTAREIVREVAAAVEPMSAVEWVWVTGGEPADHDLTPLVAELRRLTPFRVAVATSGHRHRHLLSHPCRVDWLSVSPHSPAAWWVRSGSELKLVAGLNGVRLADFAPLLTGDVERLFSHLYVAPAWGDPDAVAECREWVLRRPGWRMTTQAHKLWCLP